jgi:SAM-dependent methyltransferase
MGETMFSSAEAYERFMGRWSRALAPALVRFAGVRDGETVLDAGSGTGALTAALVALAPSIEVIGIDPTRAYVEFASARQRDPRVHIEVGDAQHLRFSDAAFDRALSLLVVNFIPDPDRALDEMIRTTRPGGILAAAVWDYGDGMEMLRLFWDELVALDPGAAARDERHMPLCRNGELSALWHTHGLIDIDEDALVIDMRYPSFDDYWEPFLLGQGPAGSYVTTLAPNMRERLQQRLRQRLLGRDADREIALTARAWAVRGVVPRAQPS